MIKQPTSNVHVEHAPAKINLFLHITGRRHDGFHELQSLVCFARDIGDKLTFGPGAPAKAKNASPDITTSGRFAAGIKGPNLAATAIKRLNTALPLHVLEFQSLNIEKNLPVAAGIGSGSADAAAVLRAAKTYYPDHADDIDWRELAVSLGADVPVCVGATAAWMTGIGEMVAPVDAFPELTAVLVNPQVQVPDDKTARVFKTLNAPALKPTELGGKTPNTELDFTSAVTLINGLLEKRNDLEAPAFELVPEAAQVVSELRGTEGCQLARLSGAGPTGFGLYRDIETANEAATALQRANPDWWVVATRLG